jgi:hypothetical protein
MFIQNVCIQPKAYTAQQPRRPQSEVTMPLKPQILCHKVYFPTAHISCPTDVVLLTLYLYISSSYSNNKVQFSSWFSVLGLCVIQSNSMHVAFLLLTIVNILQNYYLAEMLYLPYNNTLFHGFHDKISLKWSDLNQQITCN